MIVQAKAIGTVARMFHENPAAEFVDSLIPMLLHSQRFLCKENEYIHYDKGEVSYHELGRNRLSEKFRGDWLLMLDTDHIFDPDLLERILNFQQRFDASVVACCYLKKVPPHAPVAAAWINEKHLVPVLDIPRDRDYILTGAVGAGGLWVKREVYEKLHNHFECGPFTVRDKFSEDFSFCLRCHDLGIPIHLAIQIEIPHLIRKPLMLADYVAPENAMPVVSERGTLLMDTLGKV